jgi:hypothetical protein
MLKLLFPNLAGPRGDCEIQSGWFWPVWVSAKTAMLLAMSGMGFSRSPVSGLTRNTWKSNPWGFTGWNVNEPNFMMFAYWWQRSVVLL